MSVDPSVQASGNIQDPSAMAENKSAQATGMHLYFPCGIIRGALSNLGISCAVSADISNLPACEPITFTLELRSIISQKNFPRARILFLQNMLLTVFCFICTNQACLKKAIICDVFIIVSKTLHFSLLMQVLSLCG